METRIRIQGSNDKVVDFQAELFDLSESVFGRPGPVGGGADGFSGKTVRVDGGPDRSQLSPKFFLDSFDIPKDALGVFLLRREGDVNPVFGELLGGEGSKRLFQYFIGLVNAGDDNKVFEPIVSPEIGGLLGPVDLELVLVAAVPHGDSDQVNDGAINPVDHQKGDKESHRQRGDSSQPDRRKQNSPGDYPGSNFEQALEKPIVFLDKLFHFGFRYLFYLRRGNRGLAGLIFPENCFLIFSAVSGRKGSKAKVRFKRLETKWSRFFSNASPDFSQGLWSLTYLSNSEIFDRKISSAWSKRWFSLNSPALVTSTEWPNTSFPSASLAILETRFPSPFARSELYVSLSFASEKSPSSNGENFAKR